MIFKEVNMIHGLSTRGYRIKLMAENSGFNPFNHRQLISMQISLLYLHKISCLVMRIKQLINLYTLHGMFGTGRVKSSNSSAVSYN